MRIGRTVFILVALVGASLANAADKKVESLLSHMRAAYKSVKGARYTTETTLIGQADEKQKITSDFAYKSPNMIRIIIKADQLPTPITIVTDGKKVNGSGPGGSAPEQDYKVDDFERLTPSNLESLSFWDYERQLSTDDKGNMHKSTFNIVEDEAWDGKRWTVLEETDKAQDVWVRYFIDPKSNFIWRTVVYKNSDHDKLMLDSKLTELDTDAHLDDGMFKIS